MDDTLEHVVRLMSAVCLNVQKGYACFEAPMAPARDRLFRAHIDTLRVAFAGRYINEQHWYEVALRFYARPEFKGQSIAQSANARVFYVREIAKPDVPYYRGETMKQLENKEYVLTAECVKLKGNSAFFYTPLRQFPRPKFEAALSSFPKTDQCDTPELGKRYDLSMRFYTTKNGGYPHADNGGYPHVDITRVEPATSSVVPRFSCRTLSAAEVNEAALNVLRRKRIKPRTEVKEFTVSVSAQVHDIRGKMAFFNGHGNGFKPTYFVVHTCSRAFTVPPAVGEWYELDVVLDEALTRHQYPHVKVERATRTLTPTSTCTSPRFESSADGPSEGSADSETKLESTDVRREHTGVVCYDDGELRYVYSPKLGCEVVLSSSQNLRSGDWIEFNVEFDGNNNMLAVDAVKIDPVFPSTPLHRSVLIECEITAVLNLIDDSVCDQANSSFVRGIRDPHGLLRDVTPGKHGATIRYIYEEGAPLGFWQLEYID